MGVEIRNFDSLGHANFGWLDAHHHFSFGEYYDPSRVHVGPLRVWNDDRIQPGTGFDMHPHRDMEIITYVRTGAITHRDSMGNVGRTEAGDIQVMSAGSGIFHSEHNLEDEETTLFQIWIMPRTSNLKPRWETRQFPKGHNDGRLTALASGQAEYSDAAPIDQDATLFAATLAPGEVVTHVLRANRQAYLVAARGSFLLNDEPVSARDGVVVRDEGELAITARDDVELILIDLPRGRGE
ncbi:pirin family protein [Aestuariispira ectoiniformans]|uniref:pirin family protein n=1 Tax=Aestuariispira ectoiniformans TaxID=2775080 RepID=UPI00223B7503|nr:pirin family protein [Aestuariispira ectoiniformans]